MEADEEAALHRIGRSLDLVADKVGRNGGRVFNTAGDAVLAEFASPIAALRAAMEARLALAAGSDLAPMRFGLHVADVVPVGDDLRGDGVNVAARLQAVAGPGEIVVSGTLYDHVRRLAPCRFDDLGPCSLKGMAEPVQAWRVRDSLDRHVFQTAPTVARPAPQVKPNSVAVVPFRTASSADEDQSFLAEGLSEDIIHELSLFRSIFVSSRTASTALQTRDPVEIGAALGVRYVLSGSVRKAGGRVRLSVTLARGSDGELVWSDRIQRPFDEVMDAMDEIAARVAATVSGRIDEAEIRAARMKRPENMTAYEYYLRGLAEHRLGGVSEDHVRAAIDWFRRAQAADPGFARPMAMEVCAQSYLAEFDLEKAERLLNRALELDPSDPELHRILGISCIKLHEDYSGSRIHHEEALRLAPNDAYILGRCAAFFTFNGDPERALDLLDRADALDPFLPVWIVEERVAALYALGRFEALGAAARRLPFQTRRTRLYRAAARVARGDLAGARARVAEALADDPALTTGYVVSQELYRDQGVVATLTDRLRQAGLGDPTDAAIVNRRVAPLAAAR